MARRLTLLSMDGQEHIDDSLSWWQQIDNEQQRYEEEHAMPWKTTAGSGESDWENPKPGLHNAVCYGLVQLGTHMTTGQYAKMTPLIMVMWELEERTTHGQRYSQRARYTDSFHSKARLRQMLESWRGKKYVEGEEIDLEKLIGAPCTLNLIENTNNGKTYINVESVMPYQKNAERLKPEVPTVCFNLHEPDMAEFEKVPEYLQKMIQESPEWRDDPVHQSMPMQGPATGKSAAPAEAKQAAAAAQAPQPPEPMPEDFDDDIPF